MSTVPVVLVRSFGNLAQLSVWAEAAGIDLDASVSLKRRGIESLIGTHPETYKSLSKKQNGQWARKMVVEGIALSQEKNFEKAIQKYARAIETDPECVDAYVARGAA
ncbi:hypothetical protein HDU98_007292 [Podochytrium sp. JEL0797]|nr:hypothetical protein HDU98_007292 [Podochytrium sp. JEL0797]